MKIETVTNFDIGKKRPGRRLRPAIWSMLILLVAGSSGCTGASLPKPPDGRGCWVAMLDADAAAMLRGFRGWDVRSGDLIQTQVCADEDRDAFADSILHMTR